MFILLGYVSLYVIQLYRQYQRRRHYASIMLRALRNGSVLVQRGKTAQHGSVGALLNSSLLSCTKSYKETQLLSDDDLAVSVVCPKQKVDLTGWTSYLDIHPAQDSSSSVVALLEAGRPENLDAFITSTMQVPLAYQVHVLKHGCPIAWRSGSPFGIILHCTYNDFVLLCDAFGQGRLTLDEDLELYRMLTVTTVGRPRNLKRPSSEAMVVTVDKNNAVTTAGPVSIPLTTASSDPLVYAATKHMSEASGSGHSDSIVYSSPERKPRSASEAVTTSVASSLSATSERGFERNAIPTSRLNGEASPVRSASNRDSFESLNSNSVSAGQQGLNSGKVNSTKVESLDREPAEKASGSLTSSVVSEESLASDSSPHSKAQSSEALTTSWQSLSAHSTGKTPQHYSASNGSEHNNIQDSGKTNATFGAQTEVSVRSDSPVVSKFSSTTETIAAASLESPEKIFKPESSPSKSPPNTNGSVNAATTDKEKDANGTNGISSANGTNSTDGTDAAGDGGWDRKFSKPPNVVVYCGNKDTARKFDIIRAGLEQCLNTDAYTIYLLPHEDFISLPWEDNCAALIISHDYLHDNIGRKCVDYLLKGGKVVSFGSSMEAEFVVRKEVQKRPSVSTFRMDKWRDVSAIQGRYHYVRNNLKKDNSSMDALVVDPKTSEPLVIQLMLSAHHGNGRAIFSQLFLERDPTELALDSKTFSRLKQSNAQRLQVLRHLLSLLDLDTSVSPPPPLTPCYMLAQDQTLTKSLLDIIGSRMKQGVIKSRSLSLKFVSVKSGTSALKATSDVLPVVTDLTLSGDGQPLTYFDPQVYWSHLTSSVLGRVVFYTDVIPTTMTIFEGIQFSIPDKLGVIAVAGRQTSGKGRGGNTWLSPEGCAMFTMPLQVPVDSTLGQRVSFLQHIAALAVVHAIRTMPGYESLDLRLKWPNDIYYGNRMKLGGVLVTSTVMGSAMHAVIGCGVNVANSQPTICINDVIHQHNTERGSNLRPLSTSEVLARTVSALETALTQFQEKGHLDFCQQYYKYWLHSGAKVKVESEGNAEVEVTGLDDYGFLRVVNSQGQQLSVQPDGNSFDMLRNLIATKRE